MAKPVNASFENPAPLSSLVVIRLPVDRYDGLVRGWLAGLVGSTYRDCGDRQKDS